MCSFVILFKGTNRIGITCLAFPFVSDGIVRQAIASWVDLEAKRYQLTLDGLTNVDADQVVDHSLVATWAESLDQAE